MPSPILILVGLLTIFTITEQANNSLKEIEKILKNLAIQTAPKNQAKYSLHRGSQQRRDKYQDSLNSVEAEDQALLYQLKNERIQQQLEDDLEQALRFESDRICKATGRCGCYGSRCGKPYRTMDSTVNDVEQILNELNKDLHENQNKHSIGDKLQHYDERKQIYSNTQQKEDDRRQRYDEKYYNQRQQDDDRQQVYSYIKQNYDERKQEQRDRNQRYGEKRQGFGIQQQRYDDRRQEYENRKQHRDNRRERFGEKQQEYRYERHQYDDRQQERGNRKQERDDRKQRYGTQRQEFDFQQWYDERQEYDDRKQHRDDKRQKYGRDENDIMDQTLKSTANKYKNDVDIIVLEVPEPRDSQDRNDNMEVIDMRELGIRDLFQQ